MMKFVILACATILVFTMLHVAFKFYIMIFKKLFNLSSPSEQTSPPEQKEIILDQETENESLEKLKIVTNELISIEAEFIKNKIHPHLKKVIELQAEIVQFFYKNPESLTDNFKRLILNYTNPILNVLKQWRELNSKSKVKPPGLEEKIVEVLDQWHERLEKIQAKLLNKEFELLDAEIQALLEGLKLDN